MPFFLNPRFAVIIMIGLPMLGGAAVHPQGASAFVMGAWAGVIIAVPPLMICLWVLGLRSLAQLVRPLIRLPIMIGLTFAILWMSGTDIGLGPQIAGAGAGLWWMRRNMGRALI